MPTRDYFQKAMRERRESDRDVGSHPHTQNLKLKTELRLDLKRWLLDMMPRKFYRAFSTAHEEYIANLQDVILNGGQVAIALPRSDGKTTIALGAALWALLNGHRKYLVIIAARSDLAKKIIKTTKTELETNQQIAELYPEVVHYVRALGGQPQRAASQLADGRQTRMSWSTEMIVFPDFVSKDGFGEVSAQAVLQSAGLTGAVRGFQYGRPDGKTIRPDMVIIDDPQTRESAKSPAQTQDREALIMGDVMGLGGYDLQMAAVCACTVIAPDDLSERILRSWKSTRVGWLSKIPGADKTLWARYMQKRHEIKTLPTQTKQKILNELYLANRAEMDAGGESSWSERIFPGDISSLQSAYNKRADVGEDAFFSEYQNQPRRESANIYELTRDTVLSRLSGFRRGEIAADANYLVVASDVNYFGLTWVALAVRNDFCGFVADYGVWPGDGKDIVTNKASEEAEIYEALSEYLAFIRNKFDRISALGIDGNRFTVPVQKFVLQNRRQLPFNLWDLRGHAATNYRPLQKDSPRLIGTNRTRCHLQKSANYADVFEGLFDSYYWHVVMQKSFLVSPGGRGSTSIYGDGRASHADFADQICADRLKDIYERGGQLRYEWQTVGRNDYGDALTMAQVLANLLGVEVDGVPAARKRPPAKRRAARVG